MSKTIIILLSLLVILDLRAMSSEDCYFQAKSFSGTNAIDYQCYLSENLTESDLFEKKVQGENIIIEASKNILWITHLNTFGAHQAKPIAGENSLLNEILAISLSSDEKLLAVLDRNSEERRILLFGSHLSGHIKPYYIFDNPELETAKTLSFDSETKKIFYIVRETDLHQLYSLGIYDKKKAGPYLLQKITEPLSLTQSSDYLFILDGTQKVQIYNKEMTWVSTIPIEATAMRAASSIRYSNRDRTLYVSDDSGVTIHYLID